MSNFAENLAQLPAADDLSKLELIDSSGNAFAIIENKPGSQGSLRLYRYLAEKWGSINPAAAEEGLAIYAEHTDDAHLNPGKHPNIDRLLEIIASGNSYSVRLTAA